MHLPWQQSDLHPHALSLTDVDVTAPDFEIALLDDLAAFDPPAVIHRYRIVAPLDHATATLKKAGFAAVRLTRLFTPRLPCQTQTLMDVPPPRHVSAHWFKPGERAPWSDWIAAHWRHYCAVHPTNPPREPVAGLGTIFAGRDLTFGLALREGPQGRVRAFGSLRSGHAIGWLGGDADLLPQTFAACLHRATSLGWTTATLEVEDEDRGLWSLVDRLDMAPQETFVTWHRERAAAPVAAH